jgi:hypothetical protein
MFYPCISATQVAAIIGKKIPYHTVSQAMYEVFKKDKAVAQTIEAIEKAHHRKPTKNFRGAFVKDREIQKSVFAALDTCKTTDEAIAKEITATKILRDAEAKSHELDMKVAAGMKVDEDEVVSVRSAVKTAAAAKTAAEEAVAAAPSVAKTLDAVEAACQKVIDRTPNMSKEMATQLLADARGEVSKKRGLANEDKILNTYEEARQVVLTERNTRMLRMEKETFVLVGRTDGYVAEQKRVVDSKDRMRYWAAPPVYDIIQLRVYAHMLDAIDCEMIENFPDGTTRHTVYLNDPDEWADIEANLNLAARRMNEILADESRLEDLVFENTVEDGA